MAQYRFGVDPKFCIGYSVRPSERRKGYAKMALQNLLQWLKDQGHFYEKGGIPMAGRKPKPTALKKLEGNPGKRKLVSAK